MGVGLMPPPKMIFRDRRLMTILWADALLQWEDVYGDEADRQGWGLFECSDHNHAPIELQTVDEYEVFKTDEAAWSWVVTAAQRGDLACATALHVLAAEAPEEHANIMYHTRKETAPCR